MTRVGETLSSAAVISALETQVLRQAELLDVEVRDREALAVALADCREEKEQHLRVDDQELQELRDRVTALEGCLRVLLGNTDASRAAGEFRVALRDLLDVSSAS